MLLFRLHCIFNCMISLDVLLLLFSILLSIFRYHSFWHEFFVA